MKDIYEAAAEAADAIEDPEERFYTVNRFNGRIAAAETAGEDDEFFDFTAKGIVY